MSVATPRRATPAPALEIDTQAGENASAGGGLSTDHDGSECSVVLKPHENNSVSASPLAASPAKRARDSIRPHRDAPRMLSDESVDDPPELLMTVVDSIRVSPVSPSERDRTIGSSARHRAEPSSRLSTQSIETLPRTGRSSLSPKSPRITTPTRSSPRTNHSQPSPLPATPPPRRPDTTPSGASRQRISSMRLTIEMPPVTPGQESATRRCQITPPPSDRMLDRRNPPQPPRKAKKRRRLNPPSEGSHTSTPGSPPVALLVSPARLPLTRLPHLSSNVHDTASPASSRSAASPDSSTNSYTLSAHPRVFRSLESEFDAVADDPPRVVRLQSPPRIPRVSRITYSDATSSAHSSNSSTSVTVKPRATRAVAVESVSRQHVAAEQAIEAPTVSTDAPRG